MPIVAELQTQTYNGWSNRETWLVNLWLTNETYAYDLLQHIVQAFDTLSEQTWELENYVRSDDNCRDEEPSMWTDLLHAALDRVNWREIIENNQ